MKKNGGAEQHVVSEFLPRHGRNSLAEILDEYYTNDGSTGGRSYIQLNTMKNRLDSYANGVTDSTHGVWIDPSPVPPAPTDAQLAAVARQAWKVSSVAQSFGSQMIPLIVLPKGSIASHDRTKTGYDECGHHNWFWDYALPGSAYAWQPYTWAETSWDQSSDPGCNYNHGTSAGLTITLGHEFAEATTDPYPVYGTVKDPSGNVWTGAVGYAWYNDKSGGFYSQYPYNSEVGDPCRYDWDIKQKSFWTGNFWVQALWSDKVGGCVTHS